MKLFTQQLDINYTYFISNVYWMSKIFQDILGNDCIVLWYQWLKRDSKRDRTRENVFNTDKTFQIPKRVNFWIETIWCRNISLFNWNL
jgi:hypothetical protein